MIVCVCTVVKYIVRSLVLQLHCERDSAVEAVEVSRQAVEEELQRCRDRLRAVQVERNLLLVSTVNSWIHVHVHACIMYLCIHTHVQYTRQ